MLQLFHWIVDYKHPKGYPINRPNGMNVYAFLLFKQPVSILENGRLVKTVENTCVLYEKWAPQLYYNEEADYRHDGFFFDGEDLPLFLRRLNLPLNTPFPIKNPKAVTAMIKEIAAESLLKETYSAAIVDLQLQAFFYKLADLLLHQESYSHSYYPQFQQIRTDIYRHPEQQWAAQALSEELHISLSRFQHLYKSFFSASLMQDVIKSRIEHAQYLLKSTYGTVGAVAEACGYNNEEHFMRQFKKLTGLAPGDYRKRHAHPPKSDLPGR